MRHGGFTVSPATARTTTISAGAPAIMGATAVLATVLATVLAGCTGDSRIDFGSAAEPSDEQSALQLDVPLATPTTLPAPDWELVSTVEFVDQAEPRRLVAGGDRYFVLGARYDPTTSEQTDGFALVSSDLTEWEPAFDDVHALGGVQLIRDLVSLPGGTGGLAGVVQDRPPTSPPVGAWLAADGDLFESDALTNEAGANAMIAAFGDASRIYALGSDLPELQPDMRALLWSSDDGRAWEMEVIASEGGFGFAPRRGCPVSDGTLIVVGDRFDGAEPGDPVTAIVWVRRPGDDRFTEIELPSADPRTFAIDCTVLDDTLFVAGRAGDTPRLWAADVSAAALAESAVVQSVLEIPLPEPFAPVEHPLAVEPLPDGRLAVLLAGAAGSDGSFDNSRLAILAPDAGWALSPIPDGQVAVDLIVAAGAIHIATGDPAVGDAVRIYRLALDAA